MQSKFKLWIIPTISLLIIVTGLLTIVFDKLISNFKIPNLGVIAFIGFFSFMWVWLLFGELRTKMIKVEIREHEITVSKYLGLGTKKVFALSEFNGFETALLPSQYGTYEFLYLIRDGKKLVKLSEFYHVNYVDLKIMLGSKVKNLGQKRFSYLREIKEIFV